MKKAVIHSGVCLALSLFSSAPVSGQSAPSGGTAKVQFSEQELKRIFQHSPLPRPPADPTNAVADNPAAARLGQFLFFDTRLSGDGRHSCASCHVPSLGFADGKRLPEGFGTHNRHTLSLLNIAYGRWFFWDGRSDTLWSQALQPLEKPSEMGNHRQRVIELVSHDAQLRAAYEKLFGSLPKATRPSTRTATQPSDGDEGLDRAFVNIGKVIAAYERRLLSDDAPFDRFVLGLKTGDEKQIALLSASAQRGLKLFVGRGNCRLCHSGPNFTDNEFHDIRLGSGGSQRTADPGRFEGIRLLHADAFAAGGKFSDEPRGAAAERTRRLVNNSQNWASFKTPSLRNVARTAPYMHDGQFATLSDVVRYYSTLNSAVPAEQHQERILVPLGLSDADISDVVAFLESLTGDEIDQRLLEKPESPIFSR
jgi:cytochrome c peroxidase